MPIIRSRRRFLAGLAAAGAVGLWRVRPAAAATDVLETTAVRIAKFPGICIAPQYVAAELLRADGFTEISYVEVDKRSASLAETVAENKADFSLDFAAHIITAMDAGGPIKV